MTPKSFVQSKSSKQRKDFINTRRINFFEGGYSPYQNNPNIVLTGLYLAFFNSFGFKGRTNISTVTVNRFKEAQRFYTNFNKPYCNLNLALFYLGLFQMFE
jgi:hypothetical protein